MDEPEDDVVHRLSLRDRDREGEERDAALGVERAVDRVDDDERQLCAADAAYLLRDDGARGIPQAREDRILRGPVDRRRVVAAEPRPDDRLPLGPRGQALEHGVDVGDGGPTELQPVSQEAASTGRM